ncbi:MAG: ROK family protein [Lachnospiraceae bacterium]|nr:ROK family protein [Lachnospiraceae bacterium]
MRIGALEAGGTKMVLAVGDERGKIFDIKSIPTVSPEVTVPLMIEYFNDEKIEALGIGCFGPICPDKSSDKYGYITSTPKLAWRDFNIVKAFKDVLKVPVGFDTDVNASCLGEATFGSAKGLKNVIYLTVGTGIGAGILSEGKLLHGNLHPEAGHIMMKRYEGDTYKGKCPYHADCFEGLASGPALEERCKMSAKEIPADSEAFKAEAYYIAQALVSYILILAPERIIMGGGVMHRLELFPLIRENVVKMLNGYISTKQLEDIDSYIVPASLNDDQGIIGCLVLGADAAKK